MRTLSDYEQLKQKYNSFKSNLLISHVSIVQGFDSVVECVWNRGKSMVEVLPSWNEEGKNRNVPLEIDDKTAGLSDKQGFYSNGRLYDCIDEKACHQSFVAPVTMTKWIYLSNITYIYITSAIHLDIGKVVSITVTLSFI